MSIASKLDYTEDMDLPNLSLKDLGQTRNYLQDTAKVLGKLQQAFLPKSPRDWQYGLEVTMRGISTQEFKINGQPMRGVLDLVRHKLRLGDQQWRLREHPPADLFNEVQAWLAAQGSADKMTEPEFGAGMVEFDSAQAEKYAVALWWMEEQFRILRESLTDGVAAPILLYPHHFDLSLVWFPWDDERQISLGWSTGDETIPEPYIYLTAYPEPKGFKDQQLPSEAHWQSDGFNGAVLLHNDLAKSPNPEKLFQGFAGSTFSEARKLF